MAHIHEILMLILMEEHRLNLFENMLLRRTSGPKRKLHKSGTIIIYVRPGRDADRSPLSSAEVKNEEELYLLSPQTPSWRVVGQL
jgi:hypothetical protein